MNNQKQLTKYVKLLIEKLALHIRKGLIISADIYPAKGEGAIIELIINEKNKEIKFHQATATINVTLQHVDQKIVSGNINGIRFGGTNISMEGQRIVIIKGEDRHEEWSNKAVERDLQRIVGPHQRATK